MLNAAWAILVLCFLTVIVVRFRNRLRLADSIANRSRVRAAAKWWADLLRQHNKRPDGKERYSEAEIACFEEHLRQEIACITLVNADYPKLRHTCGKDQCILPHDGSPLGVAMLKAGFTQCCFLLSDALKTPVTMLIAPETDSTEREGAVEVSEDGKKAGVLQVTVGRVGSP